jgi:hypothetical protein
VDRSYDFTRPMPGRAGCNNKEDGVMDDWAKQRLEELKAAAPAKRNKATPSVMLSLSWAAEAAIATKSLKAMVWVWLVHRVWQTKNPTVAVPNGALAKYGISRKVKSLALRQLEAAGLIAIERRPRKTPTVTLRRQ